MHLLPLELLEVLILEGVVVVVLVVVTPVVKLADQLVVVDVVSLPAVVPASPSSFGFSVGVIVTILLLLPGEIDAVFIVVAAGLVEALPVEVYAVRVVEAPVLGEDVEAHLVVVAALHLDRLLLALATILVLLFLLMLRSIVLALSFLFALLLAAVSLFQGLRVGYPQWELLGLLLYFSGSVCSYGVSRLTLLLGPLLGLL